MDEHRQELRDFLLRACHDLRTPVRAVRTNAELLLKSREKREGPEFDQVLGFLVDGAASADVLVQALSNYALALRVERNSLPVPMAVLWNTVKVKLAGDIRDSGAEVTEDRLPRVPGDPDRLMQVLENLLRNAIQNRSGAPRIHMHAEDGGTEWIFAIRDNGPGIAADDLQRIFRPFERLRRERGSTGLGLAICREIVEGHGGKIWAESAMGEGTTFRFNLPKE